MVVRIQAMEEIASVAAIFCRIGHTEMYLSYV